MPKPLDCAQQMPSPEDLAAKKDSIQAFFEDLRKKAGLTDRLFNEGHEDEARLLVCCYIEALGNGLSGSTGNGARSFVTVLAEHGGDPELALVHPKLLQSSMPWKNTSAANRDVLEAVLATLAPTQALTDDELFAALGSGVPADALGFLRRELWRARLAMVAYSNIRSLGAHWFGSPGGVSFSQTTHGGKPLAEIGFSTLRAALDRIIAHAEALSLRTNKWFGRF